MRITGLTFLLVIIVSVDNFGCTCDKLNHKQLFKSSDYVFIGQALNNLTPDTITSQLLDLKGRGIRVAFKVEKIFKGRIEKEIIAIIQSGSSCSMVFNLGDKYLIFGRKREKMNDSDDIYEPIIRLDSLDTKTDDEIIRARKDEQELERKYEQEVKRVYGIMVDTDQCSCFYRTGKTYKKYERSKRTAGNKMFAQWWQDVKVLSISI